MAVSRILYSSQSIILSGASYGSRVLPVQSANCELTRPIENVLTFGQLGAVSRVQTTVSTCKSDIKTYLPANNSGTGLATDPSRLNLFDAEFINALTGDSLAGNVSTINVVPNGFLMSGILTNIGIEGSIGQLASVNLSFEGVGEPIFYGAPSSNVYLPPGGAGVVQQFTPVTTEFFSGAATTGSIQSVKFSLEMPSDMISSLGGLITGSQGAVASSFLKVAKPPFKANISIEGVAASITGNEAAGAVYGLGGLGITLPNAKVTAFSFNQSIGAVGATFNLTADDVIATFIDVSGWA